MTTLFAGVDVGSSHDRTALVVIGDGKVALLAQPPRDMPLATQAAFLAPLVADVDLVAVDTTGLGLGLGEALEASGATVAHVTFTSGQLCRELGGGRINSAGRIKLAVGKAWLVQRLAVAIGRHEVSIPATKLGLELVRQLGNMDARITSRGCIKYEALGVAADDLAMALALALLAQDIGLPHIADNKSALNPSL